MPNEVFQRGSNQNTVISVLPFVPWCAAEVKGSISLRRVCILNANYLVVCKLCKCNKIVGKLDWLSVLLSKGGKSSIYFDVARCETNDANRKNC